MDKQTREWIDKLIYMMNKEKEKAEAANSDFAKAWYFGKSAGIQEVALLLMDDDELTVDLMKNLDNMYQAVRNVEDMYKDKE